MPYTQKAHNFYALCSTPKGRSKARSKCPSIQEATKMMKEGVKGKQSKKMS